MNRLIGGAAVVVLWLACPLWSDTVKKVTKDEALAAAVSKAPPEYPATAKQLRLEGAVVVEASISETGVVESVNPVSGNPVLTRAAVEAVKRWRFKPFTEDGTPVKAAATLTFAFKL